MVLKTSHRMRLRPALGALLVMFLAATTTAPQTQSPSGLQCFYDERSQLVTVVYPSGEVVRYAYDAVGNIMQITKTTLSSPGVLAIFNLLPVRGVPGTAVIIQGQGFSTTPGNNAVQFNGAAATVTSATATTLSVTVPQGASSGPVSVTLGTATAQGPSFTVIHLTSLAVSPSTASSTPSNTFQFAASGMFDDGSTGDGTGLVTWSSSNSAVATISNAAGSQGLATGQAVGTTTITAASGNLTATAVLKVAPSGIVSLTVTPATASVRQGQTTSFSAVGGFLNGTTQDVTGSAFWNSSNPNLATISGAPANAGTATGVAPGTTMITAAAEGLNAFAQLVVLPPTTSGAVPRYAYESNPDGTVSIFAVNPTTGHLQARGYATVPVAGATNFVAIALDPQNRFVFNGVANSVGTSSSLFTFLVDPATGALTLQPGSVTTPGALRAAVVDPGARFLYLGGSSGSSGQVSAYSINSTTGALTQITGSPFATGTAPRIAIDPSGKFLYTGDSSGVSAFTIDSATGALTKVAGSPFAAGTSGGAIAVDPKGKFVYVVNDGNNSLWAYSINGISGALTPVPGSPFATASFTVSIAIDPTSTFLYVASSNATGSGSNTVSAYTINSATGAVTAVTGSPFATSAQPSWVSLDPSGAFLYVPSFDNAAGGIIQAFTISSGTGALTSLGSSSVRNFPHSATQLAISAGTARVTSTPQFALIANSGSNNVSVYTINPTSGALTVVSGSPFTTGSNPMGVSTDLLGRFVYVANNGSNDISAFGINPTTGVLSSLTGSPFAAGTGPQSVTADPSSEFVYAGNFGSQNISQFTLNPATGGLSAISGSPVGTGFSVNAVSTDSTGQFIFAGGTGIGSFAALNYYAIVVNQNPAPGPNGSLQLANQASVGGSNALSVAVHPFLRFAYVTNMGSDNLTGVSFTCCTTAQVPGSPFATGKAPTGLAIEPSGRFLYVANSGSNNIFAYSIDLATGTASPLAASPVAAGTSPSAVAIDGSGKFLLVTNKGDNTVSVFTIDSNTGALTAVAGSPFATGTAPAAIAVVNKVQ